MYFISCKINLVQIMSIFIAMMPFIFEGGQYHYICSHMIVIIRKRMLSEILVSKSTANRGRFGKHPGESPRQQKIPKQPCYYTYVTLYFINMYQFYKLFGTKSEYIYTNKSISYDFVWYTS